MILTIKNTATNAHGSALISTKNTHSHNALFTIL